MSDITIEILRDIQARLARVEAETGTLHEIRTRVDTGFTEMRAGFSAMMYMLAIHQHTDLESRVTRIEDHLKLTR